MSHPDLREARDNQRPLPNCLQDGHLWVSSSPEPATRSWFPGSRFPRARRGATFAEHGDEGERLAHIETKVDILMARLGIGHAPPRPKDDYTPPEED